MKGQIQILESVIAVSMIAVTFFYLFSPQQIPSLQSVNLRLFGFYALQSADDSSQLRQDAVANNSQAIVSMLAPLIKGVSYNVSVCTVPCPNPAVPSNNTVSVYYLISGNSTVYYPSEVVLYIWQ